MSEVVLAPSCTASTYEMSFALPDLFKSPIPVLESNGSKSVLNSLRIAQDGLMTVLHLPKLENVHKYAYNILYQAVESKSADPKAVVQSGLIVKFDKEQEYVGVVDAIDEEAGTFTARLTDLTNCGPDEEGEFSLNSLNGDEALVVPGALFTWTIGLQTKGKITTRVAEMRFRRFAPFSQESIFKANQEASDFSASLRLAVSDEPFVALPSR